MFTRQLIRQVLITCSLAVSPALLAQSPDSSPTPSPFPHISTTGYDALPPTITDAFRSGRYDGVLLLTPDSVDDVNLLSDLSGGGKNWLILGYTGSDTGESFIEATDEIVPANNQHFYGIPSENGTRPKLRTNAFNYLISSTVSRFRMSGFELDDTNTGDSFVLLYADGFESIQVEGNTFRETGGGHVAIDLKETVCPAEGLDECRLTNIIRDNIIITAQGDTAAGIQVSSTCDAGENAGSGSGSGDSVRQKPGEGRYMSSISNRYELAMGVSGILFHSGALLVRDDTFIQTAANEAGSSYGIRFAQQSGESFHDAIITGANFDANGHSNVYGIRLQTNISDVNFSVQIAGNRFSGNKAAIIFSNADIEGATEDTEAIDRIAENSVCNIWEPVLNNSNDEPCLGTPLSGFVHFRTTKNEDKFCGTKPDDFNVDCSSFPLDPCAPVVLASSPSPSASSVLPSSTAVAPRSCPDSTQSVDYARIGYIAGGSVAGLSALVLVSTTICLVWRASIHKKKSRIYTFPLTDKLPE